jgi:hypothetical protein
MAMPGTDSEGRGPTKIKRWFFTDGGERFPRPQGNSEFVAWEFFEGSKSVHTIELDMRAVPGGLAPEGVPRASAAFGYSTAAGNAAGGEKTLDGAIDAVQERVNIFLQGEWSEGRRAGYSREDLVAAWVASCKAAGATITGEQQAAMLEALRSEKISQKDLLADEGVQAELDALKAQRAAERAAKSREKASAASGSRATDLLGRLT